MRFVVKHIPWNKGLTLDDPRVKKYSEKNPLHKGGWHHTEKAREKIRASSIKREAHKYFHTPEAVHKAQITKKLKYAKNPPWVSETAQKKRSNSLKQFYRIHPEARQKMRENFFKHIINAGKHNDGLPLSFKLTNESIEKIRSTVNRNYVEKPHLKEIIRLKRLKQVFPKKDTKIEVKMQSVLRELGIHFERHYPFYIQGFGTQIDIAIPERRLAIYCDGDYWHNLPSYRKRDERANIVLKEYGWKVLRFWEHEINANPFGCSKDIEEVLESK